MNYYSGVAYSASLVLVGCSYKMILTSYGEAEEEDMEEAEHLLAYNRTEQIAKVYSRSMAASFLMLDFLIISHRGWSANLSRFCPHGRIAWTPILLTVLDLGLTAMTLNLSSLVDSLEMLSVVGLAMVLAQVLLRTVGLKYFPVSKAAMEQAMKLGMPVEGPGQRWPNVTEPQSVGS